METSAAGHLSEQVWPSEESFLEQEHAPDAGEKFWLQAQDADEVALEAPGTQTHWPDENWVRGSFEAQETHWLEGPSIEESLAQEETQKVPATFKKPGAHPVVATQPSWATFGIVFCGQVEHEAAPGKITWVEEHFEIHLLSTTMYLSIQTHEEPSLDGLKFNVVSHSVHVKLPSGVFKVKQPDLHRHPPLSLLTCLLRAGSQEEHTWPSWN
ncbi:Hypothetical_protein [Hexamita inflata]|uniref:Hypothetical_protein n=1 Tax=Hexamita inflata TaxID=28002 RepID=A0AA86PW11_9EUKA|nr:Hypothetical protein HINF_LOCUS32817 [Hexamita inflata]